MTAVAASQPHSGQSDATPYEGYLLFLPWAVGSKSESWQPFLVMAGPEVWKVDLAGDHPFDHDLTRSLHGRWCRVVGVRDGRRRVILATAISASADPIGQLAMPPDPPAGVGT